jgi:hypothetical protein
MIDQTGAAETKPRPQGKRQSNPSTNAKRILFPTLDFPEPVRSQVQFSLRSLVAVATLTCIATWILKLAGPQADARIWLLLGGTVLGSLVGLLYGRPLLVAAWVFVILASIFGISVFLEGLAKAIEQDKQRDPFRDRFRDVSADQGVRQQLRDAIKQNSMRRFEISKAIGIKQSHLSNFVHGKEGLSIKSIQFDLRIPRLETGRAD